MICLRHPWCRRSIIDRAAAWPTATPPRAFIAITISAVWTLALTVFVVWSLGACLWFLAMGLAHSFPVMEAP